MERRELWIGGALFALTSAYFIIQHILYLTWDFAVYRMNAEYWFSHGTYFEPYRPPLASLVFAPFMRLPFADYIFIIIVSVLFAYSTLRLARSLKLNPILLYALLF